MVFIPTPKHVLMAVALAASLLSTPFVQAQVRELRIGVASHVRSLDVNEATGNNEAQFLHNLFDTLIERDNYAAPLKFVPGLALSWKMVAPTTMELKLRDGYQHLFGRRYEDHVYNSLRDL